MAQEQYAFAPFIVDERKTICYNTNKCFIFCWCDMAKKRKRRTWRKNNQGEPGDKTVHKNKYGFIEIEKSVFVFRR